MSNLYSYVLRYDDGAAPNPYWDICTLAICKPAIRRNAKVGDWVIGTGSKHSRCNDNVTRDFSNHIVYAMKITDVKTLEEYNEFCLVNFPEKIPNWKSNTWPIKMGDCIYNYVDKEPVLRESVHKIGNQVRDISGNNVLMSDYFYYFGEDARKLPDNLLDIIKRNQGHKKFVDSNLTQIFEDWINQFQKNHLYSDPQLRHAFDKPLSEQECNTCAINHHQDDENEFEEVIC